MADNPRARAVILAHTPGDLELGTCGCSIYIVWTPEHVLEELRAARVDVHDRCDNCDDTGDVHTPTGDWLGVCHCPAADHLRQPPREGTPT